MKRFLLSLAAIVATAPIHAGTVYVPVTAVSPAQGATYSTQLLVSNLGQVTRRANPAVIAVGASGIDRDIVDVLPSITVAGGATTLVRNLLDGEQAALVELSMAPQLIVQAELAVTPSGSGESMATSWPIVSDANLTPSGQTIHLQGLARGGGLSSDLGIVNLGFAEATCGVDLFRADGVQLGHWEITPAAISFALFRDVLGIVGFGAGSQLRAAVTCDQPTYAFAVIVDGQTYHHSVLLPSALGTSTLQLPGQVPECAGGGVCLSAQGIFHTVSGNNPTKIYNAAVPTGTTFSSLTLDFDFVFSGWWAANPSGEHNFFWVNRGGFVAPNTYPAWTNNVFGYANARGPTRNRVTLVYNVGLGPNSTEFITANAGLQPGTLYHISYTYDHPRRLVDLRVTSGGALVAQIVGTTTGPIATNGHNAFMVYFGNAVGHNGNEVPWAGGTVYSNMSYQMHP